MYIAKVKNPHTRGNMGRMNKEKSIHHNREACLHLNSHKQRDKEKGGHRDKGEGKREDLWAHWTR